MKKTLLLAATLIVFCFAASAQNILNPRIENRDSPSTVIRKIETDKQYTVVSFDYFAQDNNAWAVLNKEIYIQTDVSNKHYEFVKAEGIAMEPEPKTVIAKMGDKLSFKVYFKKIPANAKMIDIIEHAGKRSDGITFFNFYNVDLTQSYPSEERVKVTEVVLAPPPVNEGVNPMERNDMSSIVNAMGPMYSSLIRSMLDAQLNFYKQPGKLTEVAKMQKQYFDALVKEGFSYDQAIKILTANPLIQLTGSPGK
ncbi:MAG: hypothetical protein V4520_17100 [Bacteroidota bacterium]